MRKREITPLSETFLKAFDKRMDVVEEAEQIDESVKFNGKTFKDYKTFNSDKEANAYLEKHDDYGVIGKKDGKIFAAKMSDMGEQVQEAASLKDDPSHSKNPFKYTKKPTNKKEAQGNVNYWHYVGMASNKEIEDMGEVPANYKSYAKSMMQDAQRELKKFNEEVELDEAMSDDDWVHISKAGSFYNANKDSIIGYSKAAKNPNHAPKLKDGANSAMRVGEAKKKGYLVKEGLDPVGKEDDDVDNDGDTDSSDRYLKKRRAAISKAVKESILDESAKKMSGTYAIVEYNYKDDFWHVEVVKDGKSVASQNGYFGANAVGNPLITKFVEMVKKAGLKPEGMKIVSDWEDHMEGVFKNNTFNWKK